MEQSLQLMQREFPADKIIIAKERILPAGSYFPPHWHDYIETELITSGEMIHFFNGQRKILGAGDAYLLNCCDYHESKMLTDVTLFCIVFNESILGKALTDYLSLNQSRLMCHFSSSETAELVKKIKKMDTESQSGLPFRNTKVSCLITELVIEIIRKSPTSDKRMSPTAVQQAIKYIYTNFRKNISLDGVSQCLSLSPNYLGKIFKLQTGSSFNEYLNMLRLKYACEMLIKTDSSVKEIAFSSGYNSVEYFLYSFKKYIHTTPSDYRRQFREADSEDFI